MEKAIDVVYWSICGNIYQGMLNCQWAPALSPVYNRDLHMASVPGLLLLATQLAFDLWRVLPEFVSIFFWEVSSPFLFLTCSSFLCRHKENLSSSRTVFFLLAFPHSVDQLHPSEAQWKWLRMSPENSSAYIKEVQKKLNKFGYLLYFLASCPSKYYFNYHLFFVVVVVPMDLYGMMLL